MKNRSKVVGLLLMLFMLPAILFGQAKKNQKKMTKVTIYVRDSLYKKRLNNKGMQLKREVGLSKDDNANYSVNLFYDMFGKNFGQYKKENWKATDFQKFKQDYKNRKTEVEDELEESLELPRDFLAWNFVKQNSFFSEKANEINRFRRELLMKEPENAIYKDRVESYIELWAVEALKIQAYYGIPASVVLAQAIVESGAGTSFVCMNTRNHFGIHSNPRVFSELGRVPNTLKRIDWGSWAYFVVYNSGHESFRHYAMFLHNNQRYSNCFTCDNDYSCFIDFLGKAGYSEDPRYPYTLKGVIRRLHLDFFDAAPLAEAFNFDIEVHKDKDNNFYFERKK